MPGVLYAKPSDNVTASATPSLTSGAANAAYPLTNIDDLDSGRVFKATGTSATIRFTFAGAQGLQGIALFNHNFPGLTLDVTNNGGMASQSLIVPAAAGDGLPINPWLDLRAVASASATQWNIAITGAAANIAIGEIALLSNLRELSIKWGYRQGEQQPTIEHRTEYARRLIYGLGVRPRTFEGVALLRTERDAIRELHRGCRGSLIPFVLIPNEDENDAIFAQWRESARTEQNEFITPDNADGVMDMPVSFEEMNAGLAL